MSINIEENKARYISILKSITRDDCDIEGLVSYLENSDFFVAPCTTQYHNSVEGGLCSHALNVYDNLITLMKNEKMKVDNDTLLEDKELDTIAIVSLCKDFCKINYYETYYQNKKVYSPEGHKSDENGKFDWQSIKMFGVKDFKSRNILGDLSFNSYNIVSQYIPLTREEIASILNFDLGMSTKYTNCEVLNIANKYKLVALVHCAEILASYVDENE